MIRRPPRSTLFPYTTLREDLAARRDDHAVAVVIALGAADVHADLVDAADVVDIRDRVGAELQVPEVPRHACRRSGYEHDLRAAEPQHARRLREVPVVADEEADTRERRREGGKAEVAGREVELLVAPRLGALCRVHERDARLPVLADQVAVGADDRGAVEVAPVRRALEDRRDQDRAGLPRDVAQAVDRRPGDRLGPVEVLASGLDPGGHRAEQLGQADDAGAAVRRLAHHADCRPDVGLLVRGPDELHPRDPDHCASLLMSGGARAAPPRHPPPLTGLRIQRNAGITCSAQSRMKRSLSSKWMLIQNRRAPASTARSSVLMRSEERRVGKEGRSRWSPY